ncbi:hypothetical protein ES703_119017 [subsurface metagenome]
MCKQCEKNPVYEFTNKRKLCRSCFIRYFQKKVLYIIRKFNLIKQKDVVGYKNEKDFRGVVLEDILKRFADKWMIGLVELRSETRNINKQLIQKSCLITSNQFQAKRGKLKKPNKISTASTIDLEADKIIHTLIQGEIKELKKVAPVEGKIIKPLYLFLDEEVLLYAQLKRLKFKKVKLKKDKISKSIDEFEKKHPEIKRAIVKSYLELYDK